jgi:hypothetical protein
VTSSCGASRRTGRCRTVRLNARIRPRAPVVTVGPRRSRQDHAARRHPHDEGRGA